jgi:hypothetical protein
LNSHPLIPASIGSISTGINDIPKQLLIKIRIIEYLHIIDTTTICCVFGPKSLGPREEFRMIGKSFVDELDGGLLVLGLTGECVSGGRKKDGRCYSLDL